MDIEFKEKVNQLEAASSIDEKESVLQEIANMFDYDNTVPVLVVVTSTQFIQFLAEVLRDKQQQWGQFPEWVYAIIVSIYQNMWNIPPNQTTALVDVLLGYLKVSDTVQTIECLYAICANKNNKILLLSHDDFYSTLRAICLSGKPTAVDAVSVLVVASHLDEWNLKILKDRQLVSGLLCDLNTQVWMLLESIAFHSDAKTLAPPELLQKASAADNAQAISVCACLCSDADANLLKLSTTFMKEKIAQLTAVLAIKYEPGTRIREGFISALIPFVNLSVADVNKDTLGQQLIPSLLEILSLTRDRPLNWKIDNSLEQAKQESAKILWNLAFLEANRERIAANQGLDLLQSLLSTDDAVLKRNIEGTLYMFKSPTEATTKVASKRHVMISYSWANQPTVLRLSSALKERGYTVWVDVEQMQGSTLEAMAGAIEGADLVLMCMSQKYKDSPNCRLEGEYCVTRKVPYIPLLLQSAFFPDGWLGIALGSKLYYSFTDADNWDERISALTQAIGNLGKGVPTANTTPIEAPIRKSLTTADELLAWMKEEGIEHHYDTFIKHDLLGKELLELKVQPSAPALLHKILGISSLGQIMKITAALRKL